jgi:DNA-binding PadR family transcriptional regulator
MTSKTKLSSEAILVLTSLADGTKHGYAIQLDIAQLSGRRLGPGSLYGAIARLEAAGYIAATEAVGARRPYRLTASGASALAAAVESLRKVTTTAASRLAMR